MCILVKTYLLQINLSSITGSICRAAASLVYQRKDSLRGIWFVGATSKREAKKILQDNLHVGSIAVVKQKDIPAQYQNLHYREIKKYRKSPCLNSKLMLQ